MHRHINTVGRNAKKIFTEPKVSYGILVVALLCMAAVSKLALDIGSSQSEGIRAVPSAHYSVGQAVNANEIALTVDGFREDVEGLPYLKPDAGNKFLIPTVSITNHTASQFDLIPLLFFYIKDAEGNVYDITAAPIHTAQVTGPILPGETVKEELGFEVPANIDHPTLYFERGTPDHLVVAVDLD
ncbi:MAG TPA: DUF4352 domain-containing protein [Candidatus Paceibacterota bacterium]|nr:DUF4352 domain-containing protein [Candidatus Paceibacterota bacterium]